MTTYIAQSRMQGCGAVAQGNYDAGEMVETKPILILAPDEVSMGFLSRRRKFTADS